MPAMDADGVEWGSGGEAISDATATVDTVNPFGNVNPGEPADPFAAADPVDGDIFEKEGDEEDDMVVPPLDTLENLPAYSKPAGSDEPDATLEVNSGDEDKSADILDGTRTAVEQLMENMDRDHAMLENEVESLSQKEQEVNGANADSTATAGESPELTEEQADAEALANAEVNEAKAYWHKLNHMYKNIKDAAKDMQGYLAQASARGTGAASRHAVQMLATAAALDEDEDIRKINLMHTTKRSVDVEAETESDADTTNDKVEAANKQGKRPALRCQSEAEKAQLEKEKESKKKLDDDQQRAMYDAQKMYFDPYYMKKWYRENNPKYYVEHFADDIDDDKYKVKCTLVDEDNDGNDGDNNNINNNDVDDDSKVTVELAKRTNDAAPAKGLSVEEKKFRGWLKKEKPEFYRIHYGNDFDSANAKVAKKLEKREVLRRENKNTWEEAYEDKKKNELELKHEEYAIQNMYLEPKIYRT
ncbi:hypothetical protein Sste5346_007864 [Sporothrix stenoceras]|uniref:Uncharacterized protein n=1 Tax=Sporothrix stenoceras TaxID=5173 RepID=A0ABR3YT16_9PEZI